MREAEEVDEPHADEDGGEVLAHEVDGDQVEGEQRAAPGHQLGVDDPVSQVASHQPGQAVGHTTGDSCMKSFMVLQPLVSFELSSNVQSCKFKYS